MRAALIVAHVMGGATGVFLSRLVWTVASDPTRVCSQGPGDGPCTVPPPFWPFAIVGAVLGAVLVGLCLVLVSRSLDDAERPATPAAPDQGRRR